MKTAPIGKTDIQTKHTFRKAGTAAGMAAVTAYIVKNSKDIFIKGGKAAAKELGYTNKIAGIAAPAAICAGALFVGSAIGRFLGSMVDKLTHKKVDTQKA